MPSIFKTRALRSGKIYFLHADLNGFGELMTVPSLKLLSERKIGELVLCDPPTQRWEASGVLVKDRHYFVVFDDHGEIARVSDDLLQNDSNGLFGVRHADYGFEGITYNAAKHRFYLLVEARKHAKSCYKALVVEYDREFKHVKERPIEFAFESGNKGFEAIVHVRDRSNDYLLALCEGNRCRSGNKGRKPGDGRVLLFKKEKKRWLHSRTIKLPRSLPFVDYSGMSIDGEHVAIVSQVNSMLWVGHLNEADWSWRDEGQLFEFPRSANGSILYGNIEGVGWITSTRIVTVSDRRKKTNQPDKELSKKDQSIHIFEIP
jgi:hypothetical protein